MKRGSGEFEFNFVLWMERVCNQSTKIESKIILMIKAERLLILERFATSRRFAASGRFGARRRLGASGRFGALGGRRFLRRRRLLGRRLGSAAATRRRLWAVDCCRLDQTVLLDVFAAPRQDQLLANQKQLLSRLKFSDIDCVLQSDL
jgi:hypothetical protein